MGKANGKSDLIRTASLFVCVCFWVGGWMDGWVCSFVRVLVYVCQCTICELGDSDARIGVNY